MSTIHTVVVPTTTPTNPAGILSDMLALKTPTALSALDGDLDDDGRVVLAKRLIREGLIFVQHD